MSTVPKQGRRLVIDVGPPGSESRPAAAEADVPGPEPATAPERGESPTLFDMVFCLSTAIDMISPHVAFHQIRTAYLSLAIGRELGLPPADLLSLILAGMLHDCGAMSLQSKLEALRFDFEQDQHLPHAEVGAAFLTRFEETFPELTPLGLPEAIRFHHRNWEHGRGREPQGTPVPLAAHILHLADRVDVLIRRDEDILGQSEGVLRNIREGSGRKFSPRLVEAFQELAARESFWLDLTQADYLKAELIQGGVGSAVVPLDLDRQVKLSRIFSQLVDFRSPFTARHSTGVAAVAGKLARLCGIGGQDRVRLAVAGYLHDLGKLAVPPELLEKPGKLTQSEFNTVKSHAYHTWRLLSPIKGMERVALWGAEHHETPDGRGYPWRRGGSRLSLNSRLLAVADVFTALTEDRPYRPRMPIGKTREILKDMGRENKLDRDIVQLLLGNYDQVRDGDDSPSDWSAWPLASPAV